MRDAGKPARGTHHPMASVSTDVELLGSAWPQKGTALFGWTLWRLFCLLIFFFSCERRFLSHSVAIRSLMDQQAEKIMEERFKTPEVWQGLGAESSLASAVPVQS